ncbi:hypothetical protein [Streptomyces sp. N35]|uniref:hypothetical protein n=1 Tax=Streptomyces sp. N35 TaxID=2795730 RepID=UPI0018F6CF5D|nr:hypothetical protein [Streptomyces sp. N35]
MSTKTKVPETSTLRHEAYSCICLDCGHSWEQEYDVRRYVDGRGVTRVRCTGGDGEAVRSPVTRPYCPACESTVLRVLPAGTATSMARVLLGPPRQGRPGLLRRLLG